MTGTILVQIDKELEEILPGFLENRKKEMPVLLEALKAKDFETLQTIGHRLKGNAASYGLSSMGLIGAKIEAAAMMKDLERISPLVSELSTFLDSLKIEYIY